MSTYGAVKVHISFEDVPADNSLAKGTNLAKKLKLYNTVLGETLN